MLCVALNVICWLVFAVYVSLSSFAVGFWFMIIGPGFSSPSSSPLGRDLVLKFHVFDWFVYVPSSAMAYQVYVVL